jgi:hypothetical protein
MVGVPVAALLQGKTFSAMFCGAGTRHSANFWCGQEYTTLHVGLVVSGQWHRFCLAHRGMALRRNSVAITQCRQAHTWGIS